MASKKQKPSEEEQNQTKKLKKDVVSSLIRRGSQPRTWRELGLSTVKNLPANIAMVQGFMKAINWKEAQSEVLQNLNNTVVLVGQPNTGKSTLFNKLKGQNLSPASAQAGNTRTMVRTDFGPFTLIDTPGHLPDVMESGMDQASVIVFLLDASRGLQDTDRELYQTIKRLNKPTIIAVNKVDSLKGSETGDQLATEIAVLLNSPGVIPVSAKTGLNVVEELIPAVIEASPEAALAIGRELPAFRREAAQRIIRNATLVSLAAGLEPIPFIDIPILLGTQARLVLRLAALYGEPLDSADAMKHARELITTMVGGLTLRYLAEQAAKVVPFGGDLIAGAIAGAATWSIGEVALEYYDSGKHLSSRRVRELYTSFYTRFRKENQMTQLQKEAARQAEIETRDPLALLEEPKEKV
ncbi:MAG TPA: GTPase [Ktedonobacteraceae bacterium]|nr:GTPase [Ktedonobacteraceae bacterium]